MARMLLCLLLALGNVAFGARLIDVTVEPQGEEAIVKAEVLVERGDTDFKLALKAFTVSGEDKDRYTEFTAKDQTELIRIPQAFDKGDFEVVIRTFKYNLAAIRVPEGKEFRLGFVVAGIGLEGERLFEMASALRPIETRDGKTQIILLPMAGGPDEVKPVEAFKMVEGKAAEKLDAKVPAYPSAEKDESVKPEQLEERAKEFAKNRPQELAGVRKDKAQALATQENLVYFATNRKIETIKNQPNHYKFFAAIRAKGIAGLTYGACAVDLPTREQDQAWWSEKKAELLKTYIYSEGVFLDKLSNTTSKDVFLFVHGYANTFEDVILQAGRMKRDLKFRGNVMAFSWPSAGNLRSYGADESFADGDDSLTAFDYVLDKVVTRAKSQDGRVFLLAHSMGNRFLIHGLRKLYLQRKQEFALEPKDKRTLSVVAFAAPDVDINIFSSTVPSVAAISNLVSFYYSTKDRALDLSENVNEMDRAGRHPLFNDDVATINTDQLTTSWFSSGHCYYSASDRSILDLYLQFKYLRPAENRLPPLEADKETERKTLFKHWFLTAGTP